MVSKASEILCAECGAKDERIIGHVVRGVYDGVLVWSCADCGHVWPRFAGNDIRATTAAKYARLFKAGADV